MTRNNNVNNPVYIQYVTSDINVLKRNVYYKDNIECFGVFLVTDTWKCPQYTFMNDRYKSKCTACGAYNGT